MASNRGASGRAPVESIGLRSLGVIAVWGCALCVSPVEVDGWRAVGARRLRVASGCGDRWRVIRAIVVVTLARVLLARVSGRVEASACLVRAAALASSAAVGGCLGGLPGLRLGTAPVAGLGGGNSARVRS